VNVGVIPANLSCAYINSTISIIWGQTANVSVTLNNVLDPNNPILINDALLTYSAPRSAISSGSLTSMGNGSYTFILNSVDFGQADKYTINIIGTKSQYTISNLILYLVIAPVPISFTTQQKNYTITWQDTVNISVNYMDLFRSQGISDGNVTFSVNGQAGFVGDFTSQGNGTYNWLLNSTDFSGVGTYTLIVNATKNQYQSQTIIFTILINPIQTFVNDIIFYREETSLNVSTSHLYFFNYSLEDNNTMVIGATASYEWEQNGIIHTGQLIDLQNGTYELDFNTINQPIGTYSLAIYIGKANYVTRAATLTLVIQPRPIQLLIGNQIVSNLAQVAQGNQIILDFNLTDPVSGLPLSGASVQLIYLNETISIPEVMTGEYRYIINTTTGYNALYAAQTDSATLRIAMANYTISDFTFTISVTPPVFVIGGFAIPKIFIYIFSMTIGAMILIYASVKGVQNARIPLILKKIEQTRKQIAGKKEISKETEKITKSAEERLIERYADEWRTLDLDLASILNAKPIQGNEENLAPGDQ
jgi:hypothetical protein